MQSSSRPAAQRLFPLLPDQVAAAQSWVDFGARTPSKPRFASSLVLLKDGPRGLETYLGFRPGGSPLGVVAFPGGSIEPADDDGVDWVGPSPSMWAKSMGMDDVGLARRHVVAAIRETFEETGILLAGPDASSLVEGSQGPEWMSAREAIASQEKTFAELLAKTGLGLRTDLLKPLVNWISPDFAHRRFNTRYFAAAAPVNQKPSMLSSKGVWARWANAAELVAGRGERALGDEIGQPNTAGLTLPELTVPGCEIILEKIAAARGCIAYLNHARQMKAYQPRLVQAGADVSSDDAGADKLRTGPQFLLEVDVAPQSEGAPCRER
ncbi:NUDIX hydrolase [Paenarthrobacter sp. Z7-10]|uniref:NUDIX hydrolase n=1 Tax=Paenarthrobacter sp. Z7-10 TaxID=2787635 RepID=UPI0022A99E10|nr:NUDIX hydrolase [Paenarthrobacter sp. Z7-10]MCZ2401816.1 NUDIX hydrolase [Paenarthrobacter sp. Z7-10]